MRKKHATYREIAQATLGATEWFSAPSLHTDPQAHRRDTAIRAAYRLRQRGMTYKKIGQLLGMHRAGEAVSSIDIKKEIHTRYPLYVTRCISYANWRRSGVEWLATLSISDKYMLNRLDLSEIANET